MRTTRIIPLLGIIGGLLFVFTFSFYRYGPAQVSPFLLMALLSPFVLRQFTDTNNYGQMFVRCLCIGLLMAVVLYLFDSFILLRVAHTAFGHAWRLAFLFGWVVVGSSIVAVVDAIVVSAYRRVTRHDVHWR